MKQMNFKEISEKRQKKWKDTQLYRVVEHPDQPKFYILDMFPYPSGAGLHVGHPKWYIATDTLARKKMLEWYNVLHPMWFDTFWLWTENYAIEHKMQPQVVAQKNIETYIKQLEMFGCTYDRERSVSTADPKYFKRTQRVFLQLYNHYYDTTENKAKPIEELKLQVESWKLKVPEWLTIEQFLNSQRLAYIDYKPINRCPKCKTWLANEDLDDGKCERCGSEVEQKPMKQRVLRITQYADRLLQGLDTLHREESMKELERNWIGKSEWTQFDMQIDISSFAKGGEPLAVEDLKFSVYTTRIDTVFGMSFVVMAPEHPLVDKITTPEQKDAVEKYKEQAKYKTQLERTELQKEKTGQFTWSYAINPFNGEEVPIYIWDYVLANYGTGVVMAVPAHDERDFAFAKKYNLPITQSVMYVDQPPHEWAERRNTICAVIQRKSDNKFLCLHWKKFGWISPVIWGIEWDEDCFAAAEREVLEETGYHAKAVKKIWRMTESNFFAENKNVWRQKINQPVVLELLSETPDPVDPEELEKHEVLWLSYDEAIAQVTHKDNLAGLIAFGEGERAYTEKWNLVNSWKFTGLSSDEAIEKMQAWLTENWIGGKKIHYKIQDRVFSRQRYRGEPFPVIFCDQCGIVPMKESDLPLLLPEVEHYEPTGTEEWPLADVAEWINVTCPVCWWKAKRESNTMPGRAGSSWYRMRYMDNKNDQELVSKARDTYRKNVDIYVGWAEHVTRHMIYARFWQKFLHDLWVVSQDEPFLEYHSVGLIMGEDGRKMSKRRGNVVNPDDIVDEFWSDVLRMYEMFMWPFEQSIARSTNGIKGIKKCLDKIILLKDKISNTEETNETKILLNQSIKKLTEDIDWFRFNTAISQLMILVNHLTECTTITQKTFEDLIILVSPFAPHLAEELWEQLGNEYSVFTKATWPKYDETCLVADTVTIGVQINGKVRWSICINKEAQESEVMALAKADEKIAARIVSEPKKVVYVKGKILNIVV